MLFKEMKKNVKYKAAKRQDDVANVSLNQFLFLSFFTWINYEQASIVIKISINLAKYVRIYFIR